jgi:hypothetical protein
MWGLSLESARLLMPKLIPLKCRGDEDQCEEEYVDLEEMLIDGLRVWSRNQTEKRMKMEGCLWIEMEP